VGTIGMTVDVGMEYYNKVAFEEKKKFCIALVYE
jgi:hypothetical protein